MRQTYHPEKKADPRQGLSAPSLISGGSGFQTHCVSTLLCPDQLCVRSASAVPTTQLPRFVSFFFKNRELKVAPILQKHHHEINHPHSNRLSSPREERGAAFPPVHLELSRTWESPAPGRDLLAKGILRIHHQGTARAEKYA